MTAPILKKLLTLYGAPQVDDLPAWLEEISRLLRKYPVQLQEQAAEALSRTYRRRSFPHVSDIVGACEDAAAKQAGHASAKAAMSQRKQEDPVWGPEAFAAANRLINGSLGREAARDGWVLGLHEFCRLKRRLPNNAEQSRIIETSRFVDACATGRMEMGVLHASLKELAESIVEKRQILANRLQDGSIANWNPWAHPQQNEQTAHGELSERSRRMMGDE